MLLTFQLEPDPSLHNVHPNSWSSEARYSKDHMLMNLRFEEMGCPSGLVGNRPEQGIKLLGLLLTGSTGQRMASRNGLA